MDILMSWSAVIGTLIIVIFVILAVQVHRKLKIERKVSVNAL